MKSIALSNITLYVHPTCFSSYGLVKLLKALDLLGSLRIINVESDPGLALKEQVISVPWLSLNGVAVATDPLEPQLVVDAIKGNDLSKYAPEDINDAIEKFKQGVIASAYASSVLLTCESLAPLISCGFLEVASRVRLGRAKLTELVNHVKSAEPKITEEIKGDCVKVAAKNIIRELYWLGLDLYKAIEELNEQQVSLWLLAKSSIGRAGIPLNTGGILSSAKLILEEISAEKERYIKSVIKEQKTILSDEGYLRLIGVRSQRENE